MTAIIPINDDYRIELDQYSWQISKWRRLKKLPEGGKWEGISWHKTLQQACESLLGRFVTKEDLVGVQAIFDALRDSSQLIAQSIRESSYYDTWLDQKKFNGK